MEPPTSFGLWLRQRRKALDMTQEELARRAGCSLSAIRKFEADERRPSRQVAELLAECLEIAPQARTTFLKVARAEIRVERLAASTPAAARQGAPPKANRLPSPEAPSPAPLQAARRSSLQRQPGLDLRAKSAPLHNLPTPPIPLIGREAELAALTRLLHSPDCRLLTLVGPGGIGKTRLALELASRQRAHFADGVYFVALASLSSAAYIVPTIAQAFGLTFHGSAEPDAQLLNRLHEKRMLLILDNFEHLLALKEEENGAALLNQIIQHAPGVKLLVTSRERLILRSEWVFEVQGLPVPPLDQAEQLDQYSATALFLQTARRTKVNFELMAADRAAVIQICQLLEGMPLGIELAAAWVHVLSCQEIAREIEANLDFLAVSARDAPARHRSLRAAFEHSWRLLSPHEQQVMRGLAVFRGSFQREAAEWVASATLPLLSALVDKSLLYRTTEGRYDMHEMVRQYARHYLQANPEESSQIHSRHGAYYLAWLRERESALKSAQQPTVLAEFRQEIDNLRLAWEWTVRHQQAPEIRQVISCLGLLFDVEGRFQEAATLFRAGVEGFNAVELMTPEADAERSLAVGQLMGELGWFYFRCNQLGQAKRVLEEALVRLRSLQAQKELADPLRYLGTVELFTGEYTQATQALVESYTVAQTQQDIWRSAFAKATLGVVDHTLGNYQEAQSQLREALQVYRVIGDQRMISICLTFLSPVVSALGNRAEAEALLQESLAISQENGDRWTAATSLMNLGSLAQSLARLEQAKTLYSESLQVYRELGDQRRIALALHHLGEISLTLGLLQEAEGFFLEALKTAFEVQVMPFVLEALLGLAKLKARTGAVETTLELVWHILNHPVLSPQTQAAVEQVRVDLEARLEPPAIAALQLRAQQKTFDQIIAEIRG